MPYCSDLIYLDSGTLTLAQGHSVPGWMAPCGKFCLEPLLGSAVFADVITSVLGGGARPPRLSSCSFRDLLSVFPGSSASNVAAKQGPQGPCCKNVSKPYVQLPAGVTLVAPECVFLSACLSSTILGVLVTSRARAPLWLIFREDLAP